MYSLRNALCLLPMVAFLAACDEPVEADPYVDGTTQTTDRGAFNVTLWSESGEVQIGQNEMWIRVAMPDPVDPTDEGKGIPSAEIDLDAWMPNAEYAMSSAPLVRYVADGEYVIDGVSFDHPGVWELDFSIAVGETIREDVSFVFVVEG